MGNHLQKVSCRYETQWSYAGWETIRKKFPACMKRNGTMLKHSGTMPFCHFERSEAESRNLRSKSFLSV